MVSFHTPLLSPTRIKMMMPEIETLTKKRKWEESQPGETSEKQSIAKTIKPEEEEPCLEIPLPLEWQRCLDIKSGQLYFYNTRTHKRTSSDPRIRQEPLNPGYMSLDLQLNLPCGSVGKKKHDEDDHNYMNLNSSTNSKNSGDRFTGSSGGLTRSLSWLTIEGDEREMVTAVCKKCHMLVIMCKSCPSCPNCKFVHPPNQSPAGLFDQRLSLLS